jgi:hypothetical protein
LAVPNYGPNELDQLMMCPRCVSVGPVYIRRILDRSETKIEIHCLKCRDIGHKGGTYISELQRES